MGSVLSFEFYVHLLIVSVSVSVGVAHKLSKSISLVGNSLEPTLWQCQK